MVLCKNPAAGYSAEHGAIVHSRRFIFCKRIAVMLPAIIVFYFLIGISRI